MAIAGTETPPTHAAYPPGPTAFFSRLIYRPGRSPLSFFEQLVKTYGPLVYLKSNGEHVYVVTEPAHIRDIFVTHQKKFKKGRGLERSKILRAVSSRRGFRPA